MRDRCNLTHNPHDLPGTEPGGLPGTEPSGLPGTEPRGLPGTEPRGLAGTVRESYCLTLTHVRDQFPLTVSRGLSPERLPHAPQRAWHFGVGSIPMLLVVGSPNTSGRVCTGNVRVDATVVITGTAGL